MAVQLYSTCTIWSDVLSTPLAMLLACDMYVRFRVCRRDIWISSIITLCKLTIRVVILRGVLGLVTVLLDQFSMFQVTYRKSEKIERWKNVGNIVSNTLLSSFESVKKTTEINGIFKAIKIRITSTCHNFPLWIGLYPYGPEWHYFVQSSPLREIAQFFTMRNYAIKRVCIWTGCLLQGVYEEVLASYSMKKNLFCNRIQVESIVTYALSISLWNLGGSYCVINPVCLL